MLGIVPPNLDPALRLVLARQQRDFKLLPDCVSFNLFNPTSAGPDAKIFYSFDCNVTGSPGNATAISPPNNAVFCMPGDTTCVPTAGAKRPLYAYNAGTK